MRYYFAPMEGITGWLYRSVHHRHFPGVDKYFMPFAAPTGDFRFSAREVRDMAPEHNEGVPVVPQILANTAEKFLWAGRAVADLGYDEINLNLGCPARTVVSKHKGSGMLRDPEQLERILDAVFSGLTVPVSLKVRMGVEDPAEFPRLMEVFNRVPASELIVHARVQKDYYRRPVDPDAFAAAETSRSPLCYNGDLKTAADCAAVAARFPKTEALMLGRGLLTDPGLVTRLTTGAVVGKEALRAFHDDLYDGYCRILSGDHAIVCHMKEIWVFLIDRFADHEKHWKAIKKSERCGDYTAAAAAVFRDLELREPDNGLMI